MKLAPRLLQLLALTAALALSPARAHSAAPFDSLPVYAGADGQFKLYEDDGLTYGYENGAFARTPIVWHDATRTLSIGKREGSFPGMVNERTFNVVLVSPDRATGYSATPTPVATIRYNGATVETRLP